MLALRCLVGLAVIAGIGPVSGQKLVSAAPAGVISRDFLAFLFGANGSLVENGIDLFRITYTTIDVSGKPDTASGLVIVPANGKKRFYPVVYQHGTVDDRNDVPSNARGGWEAGAVFAGLGFFTILPDYLGLGTSRGYHPYVHAASQSWAARDMLLAAVSFASGAGIGLEEKLFITGYSQGGHASMAFHRDLEKTGISGFRVAGAAHLSGPYGISTSMLDLVLSTQEYGTVAYLPHTMLGYNPIYKLFKRPEELFKPAYLEPILRRQREEIGVSQLNTLLLAALRKDFGKAVPSYLFQDSVVANIRNQPGHPIRQALKDNDTYDWAPQAPTRILYCRADEQVTFTNAILADSVMRARGARNILLRDLNPAFSHGQCVEPALLNTVLFFRSLAVATSLASRQDPVEDLSVFPNPARDRVYLENIPTGAVVEWYNLQGQRLRADVAEEGKSYSTLGLPEGLYLLRARVGKRLFTGKVSVQY